MDAPATPTALFQRIEASFLRQGLMQHLGARLLRVEPGLVCARWLCPIRSA
jgi:hypothetical protein